MKPIEYSQVIEIDGKCICNIFRNEKSIYDELLLLILQIIWYNECGIIELIYLII